ncbi:MAG: PDZ domain-containing protein [Bryobacterales bacterium]|nr:PDZ domain-containing protein [Bryobacterales bacterium]
MPLYVHVHVDDGREAGNNSADAFLLVLTVAVVVAAVFNFRQQAQVRLPEDGVFWSERDGKVVALMVQPDSPAARAGVHEGDFLLRINRQPVNMAQDVARIFVGLPSWERVDYTLLQKNVEFDARVILSERALSSLVYYQYFVGGVYLLIGLFIFFRRGVAAQAIHVYILCLASFVCQHFPLHRQARRFRQGDVLGQRVCRTDRAHDFSSLLFELPGKRPLDERRVAFVRALYPGGGGCIDLRGVFLGRHPHFPAPG